MRSVFSLLHVIEVASEFQSSTFLDTDILDVVKYIVHCRVAFYALCLSWFSYMSVSKQ